MAVMPFRQGRIDKDPPGTFRTDAITMIFVPATTAQTRIKQPMPAQSAELKVEKDPQCPQKDDLCSFEEGMTVLIYDLEGSYDTFTITNVQDDALHLQHNLDDLSKAYATGSNVVQVESHTYYLKTDLSTKTFQLMQYDGVSTDLPVVDHVVGLRFDYFGDGPVPLDPAIFQDGPWRPDEPGVPMFDADLLQIRRIRVLLRVQASLDSMRGPAGVLFAHAGTSTSAERYLPDLEVSFDVALRNGLRSSE